MSSRASPTSVFAQVPHLKAEIGRFLAPWRAKYQDRDSNWAGRGWDAVMLTAAAVEKAKSTDGAKLRDTLETMDNFQGTTGVYHFSASNHQGITENPLLLAQIVNGKVVVAK